MEPVLSRAAALLLGVCLSIPGQVIEFESNGLKYQTITKGGVTLMVAHLPGHVRELSILQVAVSNGSPGPYTIRPEDFSYKKDDGTELHAWPARRGADSVQHLRRNGLHPRPRRYRHNLGLRRLRPGDRRRHRLQDRPLPEVSKLQVRSRGLLSP